MNEFITVYSAEIVRRLRSRFFLVGLLLGSAGIALLIKLPGAIDSFSRQSNTVALAGDSALIAAAKPLLHKDFTVSATLPGQYVITPQELQSHKNTTAVIVLRTTNHELRLTAYANDPGAVDDAALRRDLLPLALHVSTGLAQAKVRTFLRMPVKIVAVNARFGTAAQSQDARVIVYLLLFILYLIIMVNSQVILTSVAEEKTSRIAELLVASVSPNALLTGKVLASATLTILQMATWIVIALLIGGHGGPAVGYEPGTRPSFNFSTTDVSSTDLAGFAIFFLLGFLQMATLFAGVGSLVNRTEDVGSLAGPLVIPVVAAFIIAIAALAVPNAPIVIVTSFIPIISPFVMFARLGVGSVPGWELALSIGINIAATWGIAVFAGRLYRVGMLLYGRTPKFRQILSVLRS